MIVKSPREEKAILKVQKIYLNAERKIIAEITRKRNLNLVDYAEVAALERVQQILTEMQSDSFLYIPEMVESIFHGQGAKNASGYENARVLTSAETSVVQTLVNNLLGEVIEVSDTVLDSAKKYLAVARLEGDELREAALEAVASQQAIGHSWSIAQKSMKADLLGKGITAYVDKAGRHWTLTDYCNMAVRTTAKQAGVAAILTRDDYDLWQIVRIGSTCPVCAVYEGRVYSKSGTNPDYPPLASAFGKIDVNGPDTLENTYLNIHPNCLVPGGAILAEGIVAESRRRYRGEVITLTTASGNKITVTPNHPILTSKGFVAAGTIKEGFEVIKATRKYRRLIGQAPNNINVPTVVNEVFHARMKALSSATHRVKGSAVQFHGDGGSESEINIILPDRFGIREWNALRGKPLGKDNFPPTHSRRIQFLPFGSFLKIIKGALRSFNSFMSGFGFVSGVEGISVDGEQLTDLGERTATFSGNLCKSKTLIMKLKKTGKLLFVGLLKGFRNIGKAFSAGSAVALKTIKTLGAFDVVLGDTELFGNLPSGETLLKQRLKDLFSNNAIVKDVVTHVSTSFYDGYVYNVETEHGFYVYNNIVTHNCLHSLVKYTTIGKTEKQIQKDKDFSSFEKNPITHDPRTKKQRAAYQEKMRNRQKLLNDTRQWKKYKAALGNECPNWDTFIKHKRADDEKYKEWMRKFRGFNKEASDVNSLINTEIKTDIKPKASKLILSSVDITNNWTKKTAGGSVTEKNSVILNGEKFVVDGKHVLMDHNDSEKHIAAMLAAKYGKNVELLPRIVYPQKRQVADYLIDGSRYDLKTITGRGKDVLRDIIKKHKGQARKFVINVSQSPLTQEELERQIDIVFRAPNTRFVDELVIVNNDMVQKVYKRK